MTRNSEILFLRACLGDARAWRSWAGGQARERLTSNDQGAFLPLLYRNLGDELGQLASVARAAVLHEELRHTVFQQAAAEFPAGTWVDDYAVAESVFPQGCRHCRELSIFGAREEATKLPGAGWRAGRSSGGWLRWSRPDGLKLCHHLFLELPRGMSLDALADRSEGRFLGRADQLVRVLMFGQPSWWPLEATYLIRAGVAWEVVESYEGWGAQLRRKLGWLKRHLGVSVPVSTLRELRPSRPRVVGSWLEGSRLGRFPTLPALEESRRELLRDLELPTSPPERLDGFKVRALASNYRSQGASPDWLKSHYLRTWAGNEKLFRAARGLVVELRRAKIESMLLKGAGLAVGFYRDSGRRPMGDVDLAVRPGDFHRALRVAADHGWSVKSHTDPVAGAHHASPLLDQSENSLDLHWATMADSRWPEVDRGVWGRAQLHDWEGVQVWVPCATDCLLLAAAHGFRTADPHLALLDLRELLRHSIDWGLVERESSQRRIAPAVREMLLCLGREFGLALPPETLQQLAQTPLLDRIYYRCLLSRNGPAAVLDTVRHLQKCGLGAVRGLISRWRFKLKNHF